VVELQQPDSFDQKHSDSLKNAANAAAFALLTIVTMLLIFIEMQGTRLSGEKQSQSAEKHTAGVA